MTATPQTVDDVAWHADAACRAADPEAFYPLRVTEASARAAIAVCQTCPVRDACLQYAIDNREQHGIWGGLTPLERQPLLNGAAHEIPLLPVDPDGTGGTQRRFVTWATRPMPPIEELRRSA